MFRLDRRGTYLGYHGGREADLLLPPEEFLGRTVSEVLPAGVAASIGRAIEEALDQNQLQIVEYDLEAGGRTSTYEARISASGSDTVVAIVRDLTALRDAERARRDLLVEVHRREDAEARAELDQRLHQAARLEALGRLSGGVAHDVNNLLGVIGNYVAVVRRSTFDPTILDDLAEIENAVRRGAELTKRLLLVGRRDQSEPVELPVSGVVGDICRVLSRAGDASVPIRTELAAPNLQALLDRSQLEQAVVNLVINAQDASPSQGEVVVRVAEEPRCEGIDSDRVVTVSVSDSGPGVPPELRSSVLEPFFTTKGPGRGTGLGLAVVHGVVSEAGGVLRIEDEEGGGARVSMLFPATMMEAPGVGGQTPSGQLLVVDDDPDSLRSTARLIGSHGVEVVTATSADDAISALDEYPGVVAVLSDVVMPGRSGIELDRELRSLNPDMEVILMTGHVNRSDALPPDRTVLSKPLDIEALLESLGALVRR